MFIAIASSTQMERVTLTVYGCQIKWASIDGYQNKGVLQYMQYGKVQVWVSPKYCLKLTNKITMNYMRETSIYGHQIKWATYNM